MPPTVETIKIQEEEVRIDPMLFGSEKSQANLPALIYEWGVYLAKATEQQMQIEGEYRQWRARYSEAIIAKRPKLPERRVRQQVDSTAEFMTFQSGRARAARNVLILDAVVEALAARVELSIR